MAAGHIRAVGNKFIITLRPIDTRALSGTYQHDLQFTDSLGNTQTAFRGDVTFTPTPITEEAALGTIPIGIRGIFLSGGGSSQAPALYQDAFDRADGSLGPLWQGSGAAIVGNKVVITPTVGSDLFANGGFAADTNWTKGAGWTIAAGVASHTGALSLIYQSVATIGNWYRNDWTVLNRVSGNYYAQIGGLLLPARTANGTYVTADRAIGSTLNGFYSDGAGDIDNVSTKLIALASMFATINNGYADVDVSAEVTLVSGTPAGVVINLDSITSPANFVLAYHDGINVRLDKCVGGTYTNLISTAVAYSASAIIRVTKSGNTYKLYYNGTQRGADQSVSDVGIISNTRSGLFSGYEGNSFDDFALGLT